MALMPRPLDVTAVDDGVNLVFSAVRVFVPPTELNAHGLCVGETSRGGERKLSQDTPGSELAARLFDLTHREPPVCKVDRVRAERERKRAGIDHAGPVGRMPDARPMGVADQDEARPRSVPSGEIRRPGRQDLPRAQDLQGSMGRPHAVGQVAEQVAQTVPLRLVPLRTGVGHASEDRQPVIQIVALGHGQTSQLRGDAPARQPGVAAPRHDIFEKNIPVKGKHRPGAEVEVMLRGKIGVVVPGDESGRGHAISEEACNRGAAFGGVGGRRTRARIQGVAVQDHVRYTVEQGPELGEPMHPAGAVTEMQVGKDADEFAGHSFVRVL